MSRIVTITAPRVEQIEGDAPDGYWKVPVRRRLRDTNQRAQAMQLTWLPPYIPQKTAEKIDGKWVRDQVTGYLRATSLRALRLHFDDSASVAQECGSWRVLHLAATWKLADPAIKWADMGDLARWPMALRVDAKRVSSRIAALAVATWCIECDDAPWASRTMRCLWCEHQGGPPVYPAAAARAA